MHKNRSEETAIERLGCVSTEFANILIAIDATVKDVIPPIKFGWFWTGQSI